MRIKSEYQLNIIAGEHVVVTYGKKQKFPTRILSLNTYAAWIWGQLAGSDFTEEYIIYLVLCKFGTDIHTATLDVRKWVDILLQHDILEL